MKELWSTAIGRSITYVTAGVLLGGFGIPWLPQALVYLGAIEFVAHTVAKEVARNNDSP